MILELVLKDEVICYCFRFFKDENFSVELRCDAFPVVFRIFLVLSVLCVSF